MPYFSAKRLFRVCLILLSLLGILAQPGRALCIGPDGHLAVEVSCVSLIDRFVHSPDEGPVCSASLVSSSCGPCRDLELPLWTLAPTSREDIASTSTIQPSLVASDFGVMNPHSEWATHTALTIAVESSHSRHTVVIRC